MPIPTIIKFVLPCWIIISLWPGLSLWSDKTLSAKEYLDSPPKELDAKMQQRLAEWKKSLVNGETRRFQCVEMEEGSGVIRT